MRSHDDEAALRLGGLSEDALRRLAFERPSLRVRAAALCRVHGSIEEGFALGLEIIDDQRRIDDRADAAICVMTGSQFTE